MELITTIPTMLLRYETFLQGRYLSNINPVVLPSFSIRYLMYLMVFRAALEYLLVIYHSTTSNAICVMRAERNSYRTYMYLMPTGLYLIIAIEDERRQGKTTFFQQAKKKSTGLFLTVRVSVADILSYRLVEISKIRLSFVDPLAYCNSQ